MISFIIQAAENFCIHQLRVSYSLQPLHSQMRTLVAYIDVEDKNGENHRIYLGCEEILLQSITNVFLNEEFSDAETLQEMLLETTNMIIGSAKVLAEEKAYASFTISTPHLQKESPFIADEHYTLNVGGAEMTIAIKAL